MRQRATFADVFGVREFRVIWVTQILSLLGDQLAILALTWLVYSASGSAALSALVFSIGFLPWLIGAPLLAGLADRHPRRELMVACDLLRAGLVLGVAMPVPLWLALLLLAVAELLAPPFGAARAALMADVLSEETYPLGTAVSNVTNQVGQVAGFAVGGLLLALVQPRLALVLDAATFLVSAAALAWWLRFRPAARPDRARVRTVLPDLRSAVQLLRSGPRLRVLVGLGLLAVFYVVPEGLAAPLVGGLGGGPTSVGLILAAAPAGTVIGSLVLSRLVTAEKGSRAMGRLAVMTCLPLACFGFAPQVGPAVLLLLVSGLAAGYQVQANTEFVAELPVESRGQAFGLVQGAMNVGQGSTIVCAGIAAEFAPPTVVVAAAGVLGTLVALPLARASRQLWRGRFATVS